MRKATIREFRSNIAELIDGDESVLVTRHGKPAAVVVPLHDRASVPLELRRRLFAALTDEIAEQLGPAISDDHIESEFIEHKKRRR
jgi:prevent-host-death family protein